MNLDERIRQLQNIISADAYDLSAAMELATLLNRSGRKSKKTFVWVTRQYDATEFYKQEFLYAFTPLELAKEGIVKWLLEEIAFWQNLYDNHDGSWSGGYQMIEDARNDVIKLCEQGKFKKACEIVEGTSPNWSFEVKKHHLNPDDKELLG